jgi:hypothetical protein
MRATPALAQPYCTAASELRPPRRTEYLRARFRSYRIDAELAAGSVPWRSRLHAARAIQLTSQRSRRSLAGSLERIADEAQSPGRRGALAAVPVSAAQVGPAMPLIRQIATELRAQRPIDARGVARLRLLLCDGSSPFYVSGRPSTLRAALGQVAGWLAPTD